MCLSWCVSICSSSSYSLYLLPPYHEMQQRTSSLCNRPAWLPLVLLSGDSGTRYGKKAVVQLDILGLKYLPSVPILGLPQATALFATGGVRTQAFLYQDDLNVRVSILLPRPRHVQIRWQIHEIPVDFSIDPKLRCRPENVGRFLRHRSGSYGYIYRVDVTSLILHSIVLFANNVPISCGSIVPFALPTSAASLQFKSGVFGRIYIIQWPGEHAAGTKAA